MLSMKDEGITGAMDAFHLRSQASSQAAVEIGTTVGQQGVVVLSNEVEQSSTRC